MNWVLIQKFDDNLAHVVRQDKVLEEVWNFVNIRLWCDVVQLLLLDVLKDLGCRRSSYD